MSDVEYPAEDPKPAIDEACAQSHHCHGLKARFDACTAKLEAGNGAQDETCVEEFFDLMECVDHCAADKIFAKLK